MKKFGQLTSEYNHIMILLSESGWFKQAGLYLVIIVQP